jgi:hypothetical protein
MLIVASEPGRGGDVDLRLDDLAWRAKMSEDLTRTALVILASPDPESRTRTLEGRRIIPIEEGRAWGWRIVNWNAHQIDGRQLAGVDLETPRNSPKLPGTLPERKGKDRIGKDRERRAFVAPSLDEWVAYARGILRGWPRGDVENAFDHYVAVGWRIGSKPVVDWQASARQCSRRWLQNNPNFDPTAAVY